MLYMGFLRLSFIILLIAGLMLTLRARLRRMEMWAGIRRVQVCMRPLMGGEHSNANLPAWEAR